MPPRKPLRGLPFATGIKDRVNAGGGKGLLPCLPLQVFCPAIEGAAARMRLYQDLSQTPVSSGEDTFQKAHAGVMPLETQPPPPELRLEELLPFFKLRGRHLGLPLKGGVGLGNKGGNTNVHIPAPPSFSLLAHDLTREGNNTSHILLHLRREADHKVELDQVPSCIK